MPGSYERQLADLLTLSVRKGSTERYEKVVSLFDRIRSTDPVRAQMLQRRLQTRSDPLRKLMDRQLTRSRVPQIVSRLGDYPDPARSRANGDAARGTRAADKGLAAVATAAFSGTASGFRAADKPRARKTAAAHSRSRDWPPPGLDSLFIDPSRNDDAIAVPYFDRATDRSKGPFRLADSGKVLSSEWVRAYARGMASEGHRAANIIRSLKASRMFTGDATAATQIVRSDALALDAIAAEAHRRQLEHKKASAPAGATYLTRPEAVRIRRQKKYEGRVRLRNRGGFGTAGYARVGDKIEGREIVQFDPNGIMGGTVYYSTGWDMYSQSLYYSEENAEIRKVLPKTVYKKTKHIPRTWTAVERGVGEVLEWSRVPLLSGLGTAMVYHADMGDDEQSRAEGYLAAKSDTDPQYDINNVPAQGAPAGGPGGRFGGGGGRRRIIRPKRRSKGLGGLGQAGGVGKRAYREGEDLMTADGMLTENGIAFLREHPKLKGKINKLSREQLERAWVGNRPDLPWGTPRSGTLLETVVKEEMRVSWIGQTTARNFLLDKTGQTLSSVTKKIREAQNLPVKDRKLLREAVRTYVKRHRSLEREFERLYNHRSLKVRLAIRKLELSKVGNLKPDVVEVMLDRGTAVVTDITTNRELESMVHAFKTRLYRTVLEDTTDLKLGAVDFRSLIEGKLIGR